MKSADGIRWQFLSDRPAITDGQFDTQNVASFDPEIAKYRAYIRDRTEEGAGPPRTTDSIRREACI